MDLCLTSNGILLTKEDIERLLETDEGRRQLKLHMFSAKTAYTVNQLLHFLEREANILSRPFTAEEQQIICSLVYHCVFESKWHLVEEYIRDIVAQMEAGKLDEFLTCGNCPTC